MNLLTVSPHHRFVSWVLSFGAMCFSILAPGTLFGLTSGEIAVEFPEGSSQTDGSCALDLPKALAGQTTSQSIWVRNLGPGPLTVTQANIDGVNPGDFSFSTALPFTLAAYESRQCTVNFTPTANGFKQAKLHLLNSDADESSFDIGLVGFTHTVNFEQHTFSLREDPVTIKIPVRVSSPVGIPWSVNFIVSPDFSKDFTITASPLKFTATQTVAYITVKLKDDAVIEGDEKFLIQLRERSTPIVMLGTIDTLPVGLVSYARCELTIVEDDVPPRVAPPPADLIVAIGDPVALSVGVLGSAPLVTSWKKNGIVLSGENGNSLNITSAATLADAGSYTFTVANQRGTATSTGQVAVVDPSARQVRANAGTSPILTANAAGSSLTYQWRRNNTDIAPTDPKYSGARSKALTLKSVQISDTGALFSCLISAPGGSKATGDYQLQVPVSKPVAHTPAIPDLILNNSLTYSLPFDDTDPSRAPTKFVCTGLPPGLTCNPSTGVITGKPTRVGSYTVTVTLSNSAGPADLVPQDTFLVSVFPSAAVGRFNAVFDRDAVTNDQLGGFIDLTVSANGSFTGTLKLGTLTWTLKSTLQASGTAGAHPGTTLTLARKGRRPLRLTLDVNPGAHTLAATVTESGASSGITANGWQNLWHTTAPASPVIDQLGLHTFQIEPDPTSGPQGYGYGTLTVAAAGNTTLGGRTADGGIITTSGVLSSTGDVPVFALLQGGKGSLLGHISIAADPSHSIHSTVSWQKTTSTTARDYAPFGPLAVTVNGGLYTVAKPALGLATGHYLFTDGGVGNSSTHPDVPVLISTVNKLTIGTPNPGTVTSLTFNATTGSFTGRFVLKDPPAAPRTVTFQGWLVPALGQGYGYFLLPQLADPLASPPTTATTSPILSGKVRLGL